MQRKNQTHLMDGDWCGFFRSISWLVTKHKKVLGNVENDNEVVFYRSVNMDWYWFLLRSICWLLAKHTKEVMFLATFATRSVPARINMD